MAETKKKDNPCKPPEKFPQLPPDSEPIVRLKQKPPKKC